LSALCLKIVPAKNTGTLQYETYFNNDESECIVLERYRDSQALIEHSELLGDPGAELKAKFDADGPVQLFTLYQSL
jgi:hypothetical protein